MKTHTEKESGIINDLFEHQLQDIFWAENELDKFMPTIVKQVTSEELKDVFEEHMSITKNQIKRLRNIFGILGSEAKGKKCDGIVGLIKEAETLIKEADEGLIRDAFIIGAVQKVEHYEMASYGTLRALATLIGEYEVASLLGETLKEEKEADRKLTEVAENLVNIEAADEAGELEGEELEVDDDEEDFEEESEDEFEEELEDDDDDELYSGRARGKSRR